MLALNPQLSAPAAATRARSATNWVPYSYEVANPFGGVRWNTLTPYMRVLVVTHMWPSESRPEHGVFVRDQVEALRREAGLELEVRAFPPGAASYAQAAWSLRGAAGSGRFDVVHAHYGLSGWSALAARGPRLAITFHGTDLRHPVVARLSRLLARIASLPAAVSPSLARRVPAAGRRRRVAVLPCGVDTRRFQPLARARCREQLGLDPLRSYLLFPADPARAVKRHDRALELSERLGVELMVLARVEPARVPLWINAANAVLVTSDHEGFGLATLEALACDVPVLSTPVGISPIALDGLAGTLCAPFDISAWVDAARPHTEAADPRIRGRARAEMFSSERMASRVAAAYRALAPEAG
jgi:teichuronic acid biosynthesis glycosyltransferase TuaC